MNGDENPPSDILVIGGGVNGCGIARDAAGRGLAVTLAEKGDLGEATSSASTKLFHGGLRYLEYFEFRLVREGLVERERLLRAMPHISWPMRFVLPCPPEMRFDTSTPASRLLALAMPWAKGRRPAWMIRLGLFLYDRIGGRDILPGTRALRLAGTPEGDALKERFGDARAFEYSDCWVDDARLVALNARDAEARGAKIMTRTRVTGARREGGLWTVELEADGERRTCRAKAIVNAAGPWAGDVLDKAIQIGSRHSLRLVRGSHLVTRRLFDHDKAYFLQGRDGRIVFVLPYERDFTLIGTTDADHPDPDTKPECSDAERDYLCNFVSEYFREPVTAADVIWSFAGVRPLYDDGAASASAATREYVLALDDEGGAPILNVFGGKITTYRTLAESAMRKLAPSFPGLGSDWTAGVPLPGGDFPVDGVEGLVAELRESRPFLDSDTALRMVRAYGTEAGEMLGDAASRAELGRDFGHGLTEAEARWMIEREFARTAEDALWRRSKLGLRFGSEQVQALEDWMAAETRRPRAGAEGDRA